MAESCPGLSVPMEVMPVPLLSVLMDVFAAALATCAGALPKFMVVLATFVTKMIRELQKGSGISSFH